ncbi:hypothetical protein [Stenotrophomonas maltophilia]|uniref:hypothetical protein n=1 Tax=Stenotrophomonas maltophilia TaxID=40324 RepID=UPI00209B99D5|nr:hypothetical protein [Stenotrophomonas maltophilia]MCO7473049.1 hypothetical protein [Stenotrophomonas maltophilia]
MSTENLIRSIQLLDELAFYGWLHSLKGTPALDAGVFDRDPEGIRGITPLVLAAKLYSLSMKTDPRQAPRYAAMVKALMEAGANPMTRVGERYALRLAPWLGIGKKCLHLVEEGKALAEVCEGILCPHMQAWLSIRAGDNCPGHMITSHPAGVDAVRSLRLANRDPAEV